MAKAASPVLSVHSIGFAHAASTHAIPLRLPTDNAFITAPEWVAGSAPTAVAYVCGSRPTIQVVFRRGGRAKLRPMKGTVTIGAKGHHGPGVSPRRVRLRFNAQGISGSYKFTLDAPLPNKAGHLRLRWEWHVEDSSRKIFIDQTVHDILLAWKRPIEAVHWHSHAEQAAARPGEMAKRWMYLPLMQWACTWAAGKNDAKAICDAIIGNVSRSKLKYAVPAWTVRDMLTKGGGFCGGWYRMFQALAGSQGVEVERRTFLVDWPVADTPQVRWCAIVVENPGINRAEPVEGPSEYHDANTHPLATSGVISLRQRRYRFWGSPGNQADGHCINFLRHKGRFYVYDACFFDRAIPLRNFRLPPTEVATPLPIAGLGTFKQAYLDQAVHHMLGSVEADGELYACRIPQPGVPGFEKAHTINGLTVRTTILPRHETALAFYWRP